MFIIHEHMCIYIHINISRHSRQSVERVSGTSLGSDESRPSREFTKGGLVQGGLAIVA